MVATTFELLLLTVIIYAGLIVLGAPLPLLCNLRRSDAVVLTPLAGAVLLEVFAWYVLDFSDIGLHPTLPWLTAAVVLLFTLALWRNRRRIRATRTNASHSADEQRSLCSLGLTTALSVIAFVVHARGLLNLGYLTIGTLGNNDAAAYAIVAKHISSNGFAQAGLITSNHVGDLARTDVTGIYSLLSHATWITGRGEWEVAMPVLLLATVLVAQGICHLLLRTTKLGAATIALLAAISVNTYLFIYITWHFFLSQMIAMTAVPLLLYLTIRGERDLGRWTARLIVAGLVVNLLLVYPHMAFLLPPVILAIVAVGAGQLTGLSVRAKETMSLLLVGGLIGGAVVVTRLAIAVDRLFNLKSAIAGWELPGVLPWALIGFQTSFRATATAGVIVGSVILVVECLRSWRRRCQREEAHDFPLVGIIIAVLCTQGVFYFLRSSEYEHWKWISFFQPLLTATLLVPFAIGLSTWATNIWLRPARHTHTYVLVGLLLIGMSNGLVATRALADDGRSIWVTPELIDLATSPTLTDIGELNLANGAYWNSMWSAALLAPRAMSLVDTIDPYFIQSPLNAGRMLVESESAAGAPWLKARYINDDFTLIESLPDGPSSAIDTDGLSAEVSVELTNGPNFAVVGTYTVANTGDAHWLGTRSGTRGEVNLGVQTLDAEGDPVNRDHARIPIVDWPLWVPPGATVQGTFTLPPPPQDESRSLRFVPVAEHVAWFDELGTTPFDLSRPEPDSTTTMHLAAETVAELRVAADGTLMVTYTITNIGAAHWLGSNTGQLGETNLGIQALDVHGATIAMDYTRIPLVSWPLSIAPGETIEGTTKLPTAPDGTRFLRLVPVAEHVAWFDQLGSEPSLIELPSAHADTQ